MRILSVEHLRKSFDGEMVLQDVSFTLEQGECLTILGNSGSGKSTCLRCLNQLALPDSGAIYFEGKNTLEKGYDVNYLRSKVNMVFQSFNLFANMDVLKNCTLAQQKVLHRGAVEAEAVARRQLAKVGLQEKAHAFPASLSGGQKQRVAIARSLCMDPSILLFDEPTSALDPAMVAEVLRVMEDLRKEGVTMVLVTHQVEFARRISSKILFLHQGEVNLLGTPEEVFASPTPEFASFLALEGK